MRERMKYTKPVLARVEVKPDEAVLAACKTAGGSPDCSGRHFPALTVVAS
jgi:hypothetical protein